MFPLERTERRNLFLGERSLRVLPGQYFDAETGSHYNYFRDYDPRLGRYIESDPIGLKGGMNVFAYVGGSPLGNADPFGLEWLVGKPLSDLGGKSNVAICDDDKPSVHILPTPGFKCSAVAKCIEVHERTHLNNALQQKPGMCKGIKGKHWIGSNDKRERLQSEADAYYQELKCYRESLDNGCSDCQRELNHLISEVENDLLKRVFRGTYPK
jgi:RHS repeat-associated protein